MPVFIALFLVGGGFSATPDTAAAPYPLACPPALTSTFADYRPGHFHSGIDLKTWGKTGVPVVSDADGWVFRVSVSTRGYGKALYLKLDQGGYRVYGHLSEFMPEVAALILKQQYAEKSYAIQRFFNKDEIRVKKGQLIAKSGQSGVGYPHLHVEYRSETNLPLNVLCRGFPGIRDTKAPVLQAVAVKPGEARSPVDNGDSAGIFKLKQKNRQGPYYADRVIPVSGRVGLALQAFDEANDAENHFGLYRVRVLCDDSLIYSCAYDSFDFAVTHKIHLDYDLVLLRSGNGEFQNLHLEPGNTLPFYGPFRERDGLIRGPGTRKVRIQAYDAAGNVSEARIKLAFSEPRAVIAKAPDTAGMTVFDSGAAAVILSPDGKAAMSVPAGSVYRRTCLRLVPHADSLVGTAWKEITRAGPAYAIEPRIVYYDKSAAVSITAEKKPHTGLFSSTGGTGWALLSSWYDDKKGAYSGRIRENIPFALFSDTVPPSVAAVAPKSPGDTLKADTAVFKIEDAGSGIDSDRNIVTELDSAWALCEYDFETREVSVPLSGLRAGTHTIRIRVKDNLDNETALDLPFIRL